MVLLAGHVRAEAPIELEDVSYTLRLANLRNVEVSPLEPGVAYLGSFGGYVWKTVDGGRTWQESRLIVEQRPFYGDAAERLYFGVHRSDGATRTHVPPPFTIGVDVPGAPRNGQAGGGAAANVNFGIGLPGRAPRLQLLVRKFGKPTSGLNIKQTLLLRGSRPTEVRFIVLHPSDPDIVFACTAFGLYKTSDGGLNWVRTFTGTRARGRFAFHLAIDPQNHDKVLLATGEGLYVSLDGGENFMKATSKGVGEGVINWITFHPEESRYVFAGTNHGMLRSSDGGRTWRWTYFTTFPTGRVVRSITFDPFDVRKGYIATHDGLLTTDDILEGGLEDWRRLGGITFTGLETGRVIACTRHKGHLWAMSKMKTASVNKKGLHVTGGSFVWESRDAGVHWRPIFSGNTAGEIEWFTNDPNDPDLLWIVWTRALVRMKRRSATSEPASEPATEPATGPATEPATEPAGPTTGPMPDGGERPAPAGPLGRLWTRSLHHSSATREQAKTAAKKKRRTEADAPEEPPGLLDLPPITDVVQAGLRYMGLDPGLQLAYRRRAMFRGLVPTIEARFTYVRGMDYAVLWDQLYPTLPFRRNTRLLEIEKEFRVMAMWDLSPLLFHLDTTPFGRLYRLNSEIRKWVRDELHRFYSELVRLRHLMARAPPRELRIRLHYRVRIEELTGLIDFITGGYLTRWATSGRPEGRATQWWEPWVR